MKNTLKTLENSIGKDRFFTDPELARRIVRWANIHQGARVLEPSAGGGSFVYALFDEVPAVRVTAVELDRVHAHRMLKKSKEEPYAGRLTVFNQDFLTFQPLPGRKPFDFAVMNPPYGSRSDGTVGLDAEHVAHALKFADVAICLLVTGFEHGVKRARSLFDSAFVNRRVVLVKRPAFHGPEDKGESARRDHVVLEIQPATPVKEGVAIMVATERWEIERKK